jgi:hypothetical protein
MEKAMEKPPKSHGSSWFSNPNMFILITMDWDYSQSLGIITYGIIFIGIFWIIQYCMIWCSFSPFSPTDEHIISYDVFSHRNSESSHEQCGPKRQQKRYKGEVNQRKEVVAQQHLLTTQVWDLTSKEIDLSTKNMDSATNNR